MPEFAVKTKKEKRRFTFDRVTYARFLTVSTITAPTTRIAIIMAAVEPNRYMSVFDVTGAGGGVGVAAACITVKPSSAVDGQ